MDIEKILIIIASIGLAYYLHKRKQEVEGTKQVIPVDSYGIPIEPNEHTFTDMVNDINSLV